MQHCMLDSGSMQLGKTRVIQMGKHEMAVPDDAQYFEESKGQTKLYVCRFCLEHTYSLFTFVKHEMECLLRWPPGSEIYRKANISIIEIDGLNINYCKNLCFLARLFWTENRLYFGVEHFMFYVMITMENEGYQIIGYFSKSKDSATIYNVTDMIVFPPHQNQGFGRMLIDFSYLLCKREGKVGTPETPMSKLGMIAYDNYWRSVLMEYMDAHMMDSWTIEGIRQETAMVTSDIIATLEDMKCLKYRRGKHVILRRTDLIEEYMEKSKKRRVDRIIDPLYLKWNPVVLPVDLED